MEYDLISFTNRLIELFVNSKKMPDMNGSYTNKYGWTQSDDKKHPKRPTPRDLRSQISNSMISSKTGTETMRTFDIGNEEMEKNFPYYHILQQAPVIRKANKATTKSQGSEKYVKDVSKRDYEKVHWNGKTFTKEYSRNVRGSRVNLNKTTMHIDGQFLNTEASQYLNIHYGYIDNICDEIAPIIAQEYSMKLGRKQNTGLVEEFAMQEDTSVESVLEIFQSFE